MAQITVTFDSFEKMVDFSKKILGVADELQLLGLR